MQTKNKKIFQLGTERLTGQWENTRFAIKLFLKYAIIESWVFCPTASAIMKTGDRLGAGEMQAIKSSIAFGNA